MQMTKRKGIILAGGSGTRLYPITVLMLTGIREIAVITTPEDQEQFKRALGDGSQWGISLTYIEQPKPEGLAQAFILAGDFLDGAPSVLVLGDNIFFGNALTSLLVEADTSASAATVFGYQVADPERYGVLDFDSEGRVVAIIEKPEVPPSNFAITGLYFLDGSAPERARQVKPSARGELEIVSLLETYLDEGSLSVTTMGRGYAWLDTGTHGSLLDAGDLCGCCKTAKGYKPVAPMKSPINRVGSRRRNLRNVPRRSRKVSMGHTCKAYWKTLNSRREFAGDRTWYRVVNGMSLRNGAGCVEKNSLDVV